MRTVYIETSIASYLTARPSRDLRAAAWQQTTIQWWEQERPKCRPWPGVGRLLSPVAPAAAALAGERRPQQSVGETGGRPTRGPTGPVGGRWHRGNLCPRLVFVNRVEPDLEEMLGQLT